MIKIKISTIFEEEEKPELGFLIWNGKQNFFILGEKLNPIDEFIVKHCKCLEHALNIATNHFEQVELNLKEIEVNELF